MCVKVVTYYVATLRRLRRLKGCYTVCKIKIYAFEIGTMC